MPSGLVLINGNILTMDPDNPRASGVAMRNGLVVATGSDDTVRAAAGPGATIIDLNGRSATPGLNDAHCHPMGVGYALADVAAGNPPCESIEAIVAAFQTRAASTPESQWIIGRGYDQGRLSERRHPTRADLDRVSTTHPVFLYRACHHIGVANSLALRMAGITRSTPDPDGGAIDRDEHGEPTGVLRETAMQPVEDTIGEPSEEMISHSLRLAGNAFLASGITSVTEAVVRRPEEVRAYQRLRQNGELGVRTSLMMIIEDTFDALASLGLTTGFGDSMLRIGPAKLFSDGSIGGHTAMMRRPYEGTTDTYGLWMQEPEGMKRDIKRAHDAGFQVGVHAIGDAAIDLILDAYEEAQSDNPRSDPRHRIEHCSIVDIETIRRIKRIGAVPIPGTSFLYYFRESYINNLGIDRIRYAYAMKTYAHEGVVAAASSDAPVVSLSASVGLGMMMNRLDVAGRAVWPEEAIGLEDAVRAYTVNGAYASHEESVKGTLKPGMFADVTIFETDLEGLSAGEVGTVRVDQTILGGEVVYSREGLTQG
ncbi:MAG: amidohydrolase [Thermomicrobiales bacterium]|nr:amidohydrolase [Thermomicrobiales bacterium]